MFWPHQCSARFIASNITGPPHEPRCYYHLDPATGPARSAGAMRRRSRVATPYQDNDYPDAPEASRRGAGMRGFDAVITAGFSV
jgi:hypothetical protein